MKIKLTVDDATKICTSYIYNNLPCVMTENDVVVTIDVPTPVAETPVAETPNVGTTPYPQDRASFMARLCDTFRSNNMTILSGLPAHEKICFIKVFRAMSALYDGQAVGLAEAKRFIETNLLT
jgi:hypothetical protein